jgi:SAM-dependent methyltransferase
MDDHAAFVGSIPALYDRYLGPLLFHPFADDLVSRVPDDPGIQLLETACGTGIVTERLLARLRQPRRIVATDLNEAMIAHARTRIGEASDVDWLAADATSLPFADGSFDVVVCQFGLMFFPDKLAGVREAFRVLAPGGLYVLNVWDAMEENSATRIAHETVCSLFPDDPPQFYSVPFVLHEPRLVLELLGQAGFAEIERTTLASTGASPTAEDAARGLIEGQPLLNELLARDPGALEETEATLARNLASELGHRPLRTPLRAHVFAARRPADESTVG